MRKIIMNLFIVVVLIASLSGCNLTEKEKTEEVKLFYGNKDGSKIVWIQRPLTYGNEAEKYKTVLRSLINGPYSSEAIRSIDEKTKINNASYKDNVVSVDFSKDFLKFNGGLEEIISIMTVTNTLTQFDEVDGVIVTVEGKKIISSSGKAYEILEEFDLQMDKKVNISLYFPDEDAMYLVKSQKEINLKFGEDLGRRVVNELMTQSLENRDGVIPKGTKLLNYYEKNNTVTLDFSSELMENHAGGTTGETMTIYSIVNTITELKNITGVNFLIEGEKKEYFGHFEFNTIFSRDESLFKKEE